MADKILLCISATQAVVAHTRGRATIRCEIFESDEAGLAAFDQWLGVTGAALVYLAADTVEEDYRLETLPHATGSDRSGMLGRKLKQYYRNSPYVTAIPRGRAGDKRRDDRYLFAALTNPGLVDPWLNVIMRRGLPIAGIYLISMLTAELVLRLGHDLSRVLVVAPHTSGLRLTFYKGGEFCVSRLSRGGAGGDPHHVPHQVFTSEIASTRQYLQSLHLDSQDDPLTILFLDHDDSLASIVEHVAAESSNIQCVHAGRETLIAKLRLDPEHLAVALEYAYLKQLSERAPEGNLASTAITEGHRRIQRRNAVYASGAALGIAGFVWAGYNLWLAHDLDAQTTDAAKRTAVSQAQYREITREFPATPTTSENLIGAVEVHGRIAKTIRSPHPYMHLVSRAIEAYPDVFLQEIHWSYGTTPISTEAGAKPPPAAADAPAGAPAIPRQSGYITGEIKPFRGDFRAAIDVINAVSARLARDPAVADVRVVKYPLNVNPGLSLAGNTRDAAEFSGVADFKIVMTLKPDA